MGVARFAMNVASVNLDNVLDDIRKTGIANSISDGERRRRELDIEVAISEAIKPLLANNAAVTAAQIQNAVQTKVVDAYNAFKNAGARAVWPFPR